MDQIGVDKDEGMRIDDIVGSSIVEVDSSEYVDCQSPAAQGSERIEGIILDFNKSGIEFLRSKEKAVKLCSKPFALMANLRLLQVNHVNLEGKFKYIPGQLKWLQWKGCPLEALPSDFCPLELAVLDLTGSKIKQLWDHSSTSVHKMAAKLKVLNLHDCWVL